MDLLPLRRDLDRDDLLEHLDPALHLRRLGRLVAEAIDEHPDARDFLVLLALGLPQLLHPRFVRDEVAAVVADVVGQRAQRQIGDARDDGVEEEAIVRDEDDGMRVGVEVFLEPVARFEVEMVRRLVEQQQVGLAEQQLGKRDAHLPAAGKRFRRPLEVVGAEAEALKDGRGLQLDAVAVAEAEPVLQLAVALEHRLVLAFGNGRIAEPLFELVHLRLHAEEPFEGAARFLEQRAAGMGQAVLRQVADREGSGFEHAAAVRFVEPRHDAQQGRLSGPVRSAQSDPLARRDLPRHTVEQDAIAERLGELEKLNHSPNALAAAAST